MPSVAAVPTIPAAATAVISRQVAAMTCSHAAACGLSQGFGHPRLDSSSRPDRCESPGVRALRRGEGGARRGWAARRGHLHKFRTGDEHSFGQELAELGAGPSMDDVVNDLVQAPARVDVVRDAGGDDGQGYRRCDGGLRRAT
jgi:hypothetical protein